MDNYSTIYSNLPCKIKGFVVYNSVEDWHTIVLNARHSYTQNVKTFFHELQHIKNDDFNSPHSVDFIEQLVHTA